MILSVKFYSKIFKFDRYAGNNSGYYRYIHYIVNYKDKIYKLNAAMLNGSTKIIFACQSITSVTSSTSPYSYTINSRRTFYDSYDLANFLFKFDNK